MLSPPPLSMSEMRKPRLIEDIDSLWGPPKRQSRNSNPVLPFRSDFRWPTCLRLPRALPSLGLEVLCPRKPLRPGHLGTDGHPRSSAHFLTQCHWALPITVEGQTYGSQKAATPALTLGRNDLSPSPGKTLPQAGLTWTNPTERPSGQRPSGVRSVSLFLRLSSLSMLKPAFR